MYIGGITPLGTFPCTAIYNIIQQYTWYAGMQLAIIGIQGRHKSKYLVDTRSGVQTIWMPIIHGFACAQAYLKLKTFYPIIGLIVYSFIVRFHTIFPSIQM